MKKIKVLISFALILLAGSFAFAENTPARHRYTYFSTKPTASGTDYDIYNTLDGVTNVGNVTWNDSENYANFNGSSYIKINNPLKNVTSSTGFTISMEVYISSSNKNDQVTMNKPNGGTYQRNGYQRLFDLSDGSVNNYFCMVAGNEMHLGFQTTYNGNKSRSNTVSTTYYDKWYTLTFKVSPPANGQTNPSAVLYVGDQAVTNLSSDILKTVVNNFGTYAYCYIGTSIYAVLNLNNDGYFIGKMRNYTFIDTADVYTLSYNIMGSTSTYSNVITNFIPDELPTPAAPSGFTFEGWYKDAAFTQKAVNGSFIYENTTLYAKFVHTHSDGTKFIGTNVIPSASGNWALTTDLTTTGTIVHDINLCLNKHDITADSLTFAADSGESRILGKEGAENSSTVKNLTITKGVVILDNGKYTAVSINGGTCSVKGLVTINSLSLATGKVITLGSELNDGSTITLTSTPNVGVITSGFGSRTLGSIINLPSTAKDYILMKTKGGELKVSQHKASW